MREPCVYLLANRRRGTLYVGVTSNLRRRIYEHKERIVPGFSAKYDVVQLVWFEAHARMDDAIKREKKLKKLARLDKIRLIEELNPEWRDLFEELRD